MSTFDSSAKHAELILARNQELRHEFDERLAGYRAKQAALAEQYRVANIAPQPYTEATRAAVVRRAELCAEPYDFAWTSGTTSEPKQILYTASRLRLLADHYFDQVLLATAAHDVSSARFYFLNSLTVDRSVSSLLANARLPSPLAEHILGDYFALRLAAVKLAPRYSTPALCWALIWSLRPTVITTVNPSSLCMLIRKGCETWTALREQVRRILVEDDWQVALDSRDADLRTTRLKVQDWLARTIAPPAPAEMLPDVELIYCWQGGYVRPFVEQLRVQLSPRQPRLAPMFSLSTEGVAASIVPHVSQRAGLPIYPGCCYEFLPLAAEPTAGAVLRPWELVPGDEYRMIISDSYGLTRYDTQDVFRCVGRVQDTPLIEFERRFGLNYSFTGEKLTDCQLQEACAEVAKTMGLVGASFTCFPSQGRGPLPGYMFVLVKSNLDVDNVETARHLDDALRRINPEYASKRSTERLAAPELVTMSSEELVARLAAALPRAAAANPGQFKLLPLYTILWEDVMTATKDTL